MDKHSEVPRPLTPGEKRAIQALKAVAAKWPRSLWLFSASGTLCVMQLGKDGEQVKTPAEGIDPDYWIDTIKIPNDGGDW